MPNYDQLEAAVLSALPADGTPVSYEELVNQLNTSGFAQAVAHLRTMKQQGAIIMSVKVTEAGALVHEVRRA